MEAIKPPSLVALPQEIQHSILVECHLIDLAAVAASCRTLHAFIHRNAFLHKDVYLSEYDRPIPDPLEPEYDWIKILQETAYLETVLRSTSSEVKQESLSRTTPAILHLLKTAPRPSKDVRHPYSHNISRLSAAFKSRANLNSLLCSSTLFKRGGGADTVPAASAEARQLSARLHVHYGVAVNPASGPTHPNARSVVYDLRRYTGGSFWGPFKDDGSANVDWEKLEAVMVVLCYNLRLFSIRSPRHFPQLWRTPFLGAYPRSFVSGDFANSAEQELPDLVQRDPYGVTGTWLRVVCFLDYSDLYTYNFAHPLPASIPRGELDTDEATRLITLRLRVTAIREPGEGDGKALPVVHFTGHSRSMHTGFDANANSRIRGTVSLTPEGEVRWTTFSVFHGEERWKSEGIQVGGVRSARGVWGNWFDKDFDPEGPAGPTAFWKIDDQVPPLPGSDEADPPLFNEDQEGQAAANGGRYQLGAPAVMSIAGASALNGGAPATVDDDPDAVSVYGRTTLPVYHRRGPPPVHDDEASEDDAAANAAQPRDVITLLGEDGQTIGTLVALDAEDLDEDEDDDADYVPASTALEVAEEYEEDEEDDDSDVPPPGEDDVVIEEAYVEEEEVPHGHGGDMPDGEDIYSSQAGRS